MEPAPYSVVFCILHGFPVVWSLARHVWSQCSGAWSVLRVQRGNLDLICGTVLLIIQSSNFIALEIFTHYVLHRDTKILFPNLKVGRISHMLTSNGVQGPKSYSCFFPHLYMAGMIQVEECHDKLNRGKVPLIYTRRFR